MLTHLLSQQPAWARWMAFLLAFGLLVGLSPLTPYTTTEGIPITLQSMLVVFLPILLGWKIGLAAVVTYLIVGGMGAPVFSYGTFGWERFTGSSGGFLLAFPIAAVLSGYAMEQWQHSKSVLIGALLMFAGQFIILGLGLFWYHAIIPVEEGMMASVERLMPGLLIKTAFGGLALVLIQRLASATIRLNEVSQPPTDT
jgi:biotin transport system substrate-specific component